jgi:hypothetical protein
MLPFGFELAKQIAQTGGCRHREASPMKTDTKNPTPTEYLASLPEERRVQMETLHRAIVKAAPSLKPEMMSGIIGYGKFHYRYESGREGDWFIVGLCSRKANMSLYICSTEKGEYLAEKNASKLGKVKVGRSCINFKKLEDLNLEATLELIKRAEKIGGAGAAM